MPRLRNNILANYAGQIWATLMGVVFVPFYIRVLGMEAFGLVGFMLSFQALSLLLDLGLGSVLNRELARRANDPVAAHTMGDLIRTFEWVVWPTVLVVALAIWLTSNSLADYWLHPRTLTHAQTAHAITIMGLAVALQWPSSFYSNGLSGLERQPALNLINASFATLRGCGVLGVLYWVSPTITAFMWWFAVIGACQSLVYTVTLWRLLPAQKRSSVFRLKELHAAGKFAGGLVLITALSIAVTQLDRIVLSAMRPLIELGYFTVAMSVSAGLGRMVQPMFNALYPRYSRMVSLGESKALVNLYHLSNQYLMVVIASVSAVLMVFSKDVIYLWTGDHTTAAKVAVPLAILVAGSAFNGLMNLPYALQLAHGWTGLTAGSNLVALTLGIPFCIWAVGHYGINGAACLWLAINFGFFAISVPLMHRRLMRGEMRQWFLQDILPPAIAAGAVALLAGWMIPTLSRDFSGFLLLAIVCIATLIAAGLSAPFVRKQAIQMLIQAATPTA